MVIVLLRVQTLINIRDKVSEWCYPEWICSLFLGDRLKNIPRSNLRFSMSYCIQLDYSANCMQAGSSTWVEKWGVTKYVNLVGCAFTKAGLTTYTIYTGVSKLGAARSCNGFIFLFFFFGRKAQVLFFQQTIINYFTRVVLYEFQPEAFTNTARLGGK